MSPILAEVFGTAILIVLGDGVVANVVLQRTKGHNSGWIVITTGWALAVTIAVYCVNAISGAHLNPAVTIALATTGAFDWAKVPGYIAAQIAGGFLGAVIVWLMYLPHWKATPDPVSKLAVFSTTPAIRQPMANLLSEIIGGFALVLALLAVISPVNFVPGSDLAKGFGPLLVGAIVMAIGLSRSVVPPATQSTLRAISVRAACQFCRSMARAAPTGAMPGFPSSVRRLVACSARSYTI